MPEALKDCVTDNKVCIVNTIKSEPAKKKRGRPAGSKVYEKDVMHLIDTPIYDDELMKYVYKAISQSIKLEMEKSDISVKDLAYLSCCDYTYIANIISEKKQIGLKTLIKISYALGISPGDLFPYDFNLRKSNGARFDDLTRECDLKTVNTILGIVADIVKDMRRIKHS